MPIGSAGRLDLWRAHRRIAAPPATYKNYPSNCKFSNYKEKKSTLVKGRKAEKRGGKEGRSYCKNKRATPTSLL